MKKGVELPRDPNMLIIFSLAKRQMIYLRTILGKISSFDGLILFVPNLKWLQRKKQISINHGFFFFFAH